MAIAEANATNYGLSASLIGGTPDQCMIASGPMSARA
jgi:hypothetical protein